MFLGMFSRVLIGAAALTIPLFGAQVVGASVVSAAPAPTQARWQCDYESCGGIDRVQPAATGLRPACDAEYCDGPDMVVAF